jgi:hypothetical protein
MPLPLSNNTPSGVTMITTVKACLIQIFIELNIELIIELIIGLNIETQICLHLSTSLRTCYSVANITKINLSNL